MKIKLIILIMILMNFLFCESKLIDSLKTALHIYQEDSQKGNELLEELYEKAVTQSNENQQLEILIPIIDFYIEKLDFETAEKFFYEGFRIAEKHTKEAIYLDYILLAIELFEMKNDCNQVIAYADRISEMKRSDKNEKKIQEIIIRKSECLLKNNQMVEAIKLLTNEISSTISENNSIQIYYQLGRCYDQKGMYRSSLTYYKKGILLISNKNEYELLKADFLNNIGIAYREFGEYDNSLEAFYQALEILRKKDKEEKIADVYNNISSIYLLLQDNEQAINFLSKAQVINIKFENWKQVADNYFNLGKIYASIPYAEAAIQYFTKAMSIYGNIEQFAELSLVCISLSEVYLENSDYKEAYNYVEKSIKFADKLNNDKMFPEIYNTLGEIKLKTKQWNQAIEFIEKSTDYSLQMGSREQLKISYMKLSEVYEKVGNYTKALDFYKKYEALKDSLLNEYSQSKLAEMHTVYNFFEKEREIENLNSRLAIEKINSRNQRIQIFTSFFGSLILIVLLIVTFNLYRRSKYLFKKAKIQKEKLEKTYEDLNQAHRDLRKAQEETIELEKIRSAMAMSVTMNHEINQPLMIIQGNVDLIQHLCEPEFLAKYQKYLVPVKKSVERISKILKDLRSLESITFTKYANGEDMVELHSIAEEE